MEFEDSIKSYVTRLRAVKGNLETEEATKTALIMPFFQMLGYDVFNPNEFTPEFTCDVGIKKGEKVDFSIMQDGKPVILIEAKSVNSVLTKHDSQLFRYFGTTTAKFAILTNGIIYKFFTDLQNPNKMDDTPFLEVDLLELKDAQINELKKFQKSSFNVENIMDTASELKFTGLIRAALKEEFASPTDEFVKFVLAHDIYTGVKTQSVVDKFRPLVKKSITGYINDLVNEKIQSALKKEEVEPVEEEIVIDEELVEPLIVTTDEELEAFYIIKAILCKEIAQDRITYQDKQTYFAVLLDNKPSKWVLRLYMRTKSMNIVLRGQEQEKIVLTSPNELYMYSDRLLEAARQIL